MTMKKIGIMGGTFDPIHNGHIMLGRQAYEEYDLDCIWYMPSRIPPDKKDHTITAAKDRLAMTAAAIAPYSYFKLSDFELRRTGRKYLHSRHASLIERRITGCGIFLYRGRGLNYGH